MCSIGGFISTEPIEPWKARRLAAALLHFGLSRGDQSSGIFYNGQLLKRATSASELIHSTRFTDLFETPNNQTVCLTHTRFPTSGERGDDQAHPFWVGNTISVHNGSIHNCRAIRDKWQLDKPSGVDSELFTQAIDKYGIAKLPEIADDLDASASIAVLHNDTLFVARDGNPFEYMTILDGDNTITIFASTQSQVINTINHLWLIPNLGNTTTLPGQTIFSMSATGDLDELGPFKTMPTVSYRWAGSAGTKKFWEDWDGTSSLALTDWSSEWRAPSPKKPDSKNGGGSKAKKDRNRNGTPPHHKKTR
jgi:asparagine synthetase B (glutamine-hydrolysing)